MEIRKSKSTPSAPFFAPTKRQKRSSTLFGSPENISRVVIGGAANNIRVQKTITQQLQYQTMGHFCLTVLILLMILLVTNPILVDSRALASATKNESDDHHATTDPIDDRGFGSVSTNMKVSVDPESVDDAGGGHVSGAKRQVYKVASSGPSGKGAGH